MTIPVYIEFIISSIIEIVIGLTVLIMIVRLVVNLADLNPFGTIALNVRRLSDPLIYPFRRQMMALGFDPKFAPIVAILVVILAGYFAIQFVDAVLGTIIGVSTAARIPATMAVLGYVLYGLLAIYKLLIFVRIIILWVTTSVRNRFVRLIAIITDPLLVPLRRMIPPLGPFDISAIIAIIILMLFQMAIAGTLLRSPYPTSFF